VSVIFFALIAVCLLRIYMDEMGTVHFASFRRKYLIRWAVARTRQQRPLPLSPWTIFSFLIPFFCVVNVYETDIAALISASVQSMVPKRRVPMYRCTSWSRNGVSLLVVPVYSPGHNKKTNAMVIISVI
jgi:hypothetical protein